MENGVVNVANALQQGGGFDIHIGCLEREGGFASRLQESIGVHVLGRETGFSLKAVSRLRRLACELGPDVIHTHNLGPLIYASLACPSGPPILHGEHGQLKGDDLRRKRLWQRKLFYRRCRGIHTVSTELGRDLERHHLPVAGKLDVIENGVDCERFRPVSRDRRGVLRAALGLPADSGARVIGIVGRFDPVKRHEMLLEAFERLGSAEENLILLVVGDGGAAKERVVDALGRSPSAARIHWAGYQAEPAPWYQVMDLMVLPSSHEGMSNVILEAMACGVPVLASSAFGSSELIDDGRNGFLASFSDAEGLAREVRRSLQSPEKLQAAGEQARAKVARSFSIDSMAAGYASTYRKMAGRGGT